MTDPGGNIEHTENTKSESQHAPNIEFPGQRLGMAHRRQISGILHILLILQWRFKGKGICL